MDTQTARDRVRSEMTIIGVSALTEKNANLCHACYLLLPKLISGEADIKNLIFARVEK